MAMYIMHAMWSDFSSNMRNLSIGQTTCELTFSCLMQGRPDLTKLDAMLGLLSCDTADFEHEVEVMVASIRTLGLSDWLANEASFVEERAALAKQAKVASLVEQLAALAPADQLQHMIAEAQLNECGFLQ